MNVHIISGNIGGYITKVRNEQGELERKFFDRPVMSKTSSGKKLIILTVAVTVGVKKGDEWTNETLWKEFRFWDNDASFLAEYSAQGNFIEIQYEEIPNVWMDENGKKRYGDPDLRVVRFVLPKMNRSAKPSNGDDDFEAMTVPTEAPELTAEELADIPM
jgi:single-stranded DNA-binding protein